MRRGWLLQVASCLSGELRDPCGGKASQQVLVSRVPLNEKTEKDAQGLDRGRQP
jgi:hypothetical protein